MKNLLSVFFLLWSCTLPAQSDTSTLQKQDAVTALKKIGIKASVESVKKLTEERITSKQRITLDHMRTVNQQAKIFLKRGIDTLSFNKFLASAKYSLETVKDGILINKGTNQTQRNLDVSAAILNELSTRIAAKKLLLQTYAAKVTALNLLIDSLSSDPSLFTFPEDSADVIKHAKRMIVTAMEVSPIDSALDKATTLIEEQELKTDLLLFDINSTREDIDIYSNHLASQSLEKEFPYIWQAPTYSRPLPDIARFSIAKEMILLRFYAEDHLIWILFMLLLLSGAWYFCKSLKKQLQAAAPAADPEVRNLVSIHPLAVSIVITFSVFQFLFAAPPFIFSFFLWLATAISLYIIFKNHISTYWRRFWLFTTLLFILAGIDNMILQASRPERYYMLLIAVTGSIYMTIVLITKKKAELKEKKILYFISIVLLFEVSSTLLNLFGRFNMAKSLMVAGYVSLIMGIVFLWTIRLIDEGLTLASSVYKQPSRRLFYLNFNRVGKQTPVIFYIILVVGWILIVARNFYHLRIYSASVNNFVTMERTIGDYKYSITSLFVFVFVIFCSLLLSKLVSYFSAEHEPVNATGTTGKRFSFGSWLLVIRIVIITAGLLIACAAAGIPLDKFTIIIGALSVGAGLGLQGLVNNLVSGLIISFEKPLNVGDIIEINGGFATVKSIGFRSSVARSVDGANLVIPNGDLLSRQVTNWTMNNHFRRCHLAVGVSYDTDIEHAKILLLEILKADERILNYPAPDVFFQAFGDSAIEIELIYWIRDIKEFLAVKSDLIAKIFTVFKKENITIPFPQQDLHIKRT
ncbi:mechanosensitive ion channel family protein [Chitinophaga sp. 22321]|uniref:Mechanosensitive ion channel n=1 Tax=Chitinophaga hostae TaxID=2831022 RepID=A0ABS5J5X5_9BACT|nr:mechanosensitive ion channel domain-containing protein [Chitinophaga hostae]MBS0030622.1 mechanosensitive ion channel [Chitinophaga hostae]